MRTYRLEVRTIYPAMQGVPDDIAAEVVTACATHDREVLDVRARREHRTDLVVVGLTFTAPDDTAAAVLRDALPSAIRRGGTESDRLRTGTGRAMRWVA